MKIKENDLFHLADDHLRLQVEHSYAQSDRFQRQSRNTSGEKNCPCQTEPGITNYKSPNVASTEITIIRRWVEKPRDCSFTVKQNSPKLKLKEVNLPREAEKENGNPPTQISQEIARSSDEIENMPLYERLQERQGSQIIILDCDMSPRVGSSKFKRKTHAKVRVIDDQPVACSSRTAESVTILRDEFNQVKILGNTQAFRLTSLNSKNSDVPCTRMDTSRVANNDALISDNSDNGSDPQSDDRVASPSSQRAARSAASPIILRDVCNQVKIPIGIKESLDNMERFRLTSSDSDDTDYNPTTTIFDHERRRSVDQSSSHRAQQTDTKKKILRKRRENPSPSADSDISEDGEVPEVLYDGKKTVGQSKSNRKSDDNSRTSNNRVNISRVSNNERNTVVSSTRSSDDVMSISDSDSDVLSDDEVASSSFHRTACSAIFSKKPKHPSAVSEKAKRPHPLSSSESDPLSDDGVAGPSSQRVAHPATSVSQSEDGESTKSKRPSSWIERRELNQEKRKGSRIPTRNFSRWEQRHMVEYLIDKKFISEAKGNLVWQQMLKDGFLQHRTYQSLNNHFRKYILPQIHRFPMSSKCLRKFQRLQ